MTAAADDCGVVAANQVCAADQLWHFGHWRVVAVAAAVAVAVVVAVVVDVADAVT